MVLIELFWQCREGGGGLEMVVESFACKGEGFCVLRTVRSLSESEFDVSINRKVHMKFTKRVEITPFGVG